MQIIKQSNGLLNSLFNMSGCEKAPISSMAYYLRS
uniref:Uncharacterized protein n=1 Tax=Anguilla anguilla TaxID=7936 RepID=A0A0E9QVF9_ANGAN